MFRIGDFYETFDKDEKVVSYFGDGSSYGVNIKYINEDTPLGTAGAIGLLPKDIPRKSIIMMNRHYVQIYTVKLQSKGGPGSPITEYIFYYVLVSELYFVRWALYLGFNCFIWLITFYLF